jgi:beta-glucanase (GH16 family)
MGLFTSRATEGQAQQWELVWSDEFDALAIDNSKWSFDMSTGLPLIGWGNNELQYYTDREQNATIDNGVLVVEAREEPYQGMNYTSARLKTIHKGDWLYGKFEIRAKLPEGQGIWPAIWMMPTDAAYGGWPKSGEIDVMELVGHVPNVVHATVHFGADWPNNRHIGSRYELPEGNFSGDFHVFSLEWEPGEIRWYVDGNHFFTVTPEDLHPHPYPFDRRFHLIVNVAVGGNWPGSPDASTEFPQTMEIDYVRVYQDASLKRVTPVLRP